MRNFFEEKDAGMRTQSQILPKKDLRGNLLGQCIHKVIVRATARALCVSGNRWEVCLRTWLTDSME